MDSNKALTPIPVNSHIYKSVYIYISVYQEIPDKGYAYGVWVTIV